MVMLPERMGYPRMLIRTIVETLVLLIGSVRQASVAMRAFLPVRGVANSIHLGPQCSLVLMLLVDLVCVISN